MLQTNKLSLKDKIKKSRKPTVNKYLNSEVNMAKLRDIIFNEKEPRNMFDINGINKEERYTKDMQEQYLVSLLKSSTPNYSQNCKTFNFNRNDKVGWIVLEFNREEHLSQKDNIDFINQYIISEIKLEPTLIAVDGSILIVGFLFPNYPTTEDPLKLKKYRYFKDVRTSITHFLDSNWSVEVDNYNETKEYKNICNLNYLLTGNVFEIGIFQEVLDLYKETPTFQRIIKLKQSYGGQKSGATRKSMTITKRKQLTATANAVKVLNSKDRIKEVLIYIVETEEKPKFTIDNIVKTSKNIFEKGLSHGTVGKYVAEIKMTLPEIEPFS